MKKWIVFLMLGCVCRSVMSADATLMTVYEDALTSDPIFQQAIAERFSSREDIPINRALLLPQLGALATPTISHSHDSNSGLSGTARGYSLALNVTQTVFDFSKFHALSGAKAEGKQADAQLNAAAQNLILRVSSAYFAILQDKDNLTYIRANQEAYGKQLDQVNQQYKVGLKTLTDVYTAEASYDTASAERIAAEAALENDKENLRVITGAVYPHFAKLSEKFPLISPLPSEREAWVKTALQQNWDIKSAQYAVLASLDKLKQQNAGHYPTLNLQGSYTYSYSSNISSTVDLTNNTLYPGHITDAALSMNLGVPLFQGGLVVSKTNKARYDYQVALRKLDESRRNTANSARQSYLNIMAGIRKMEADKLAVKSAISSYEGLEAGYHVGTQTLVDVLNQLQKVYQAELTYSKDRYAYLNNLLILKDAAGTLSVADVQAVNAWLVNDKKTAAPWLQAKRTTLIRVAKVEKSKILSSVKNTGSKQKDIEKDMQRLAEQA